MTRTLRRAAVVATVVVVASLVAPVAAQAAAAPAVTITSVAGLTPTSQLPVSGSVHVVASATPDTGDAMASVELFLDTVSPATSQGTFSCPGGVDIACTADLVWDATGAQGVHALIVEATSLAGVSTGTDNATVKVMDASATVTPPGGGSPVHGQVAVKVSGQVGAPDFPTTVELTANGLPVPGPIICGGGPTCSGTVTWDSTASTSVTFAAVLHTNNGLTVPSPNVTVSVSNPGPTVNITSPLPNAGVSGTVIVNVQAFTDGGVTDLPTGLTLIADGVVVDQRTCTGVAVDPHICSQPMSWDASGLTGTSTLVARLTTSKPAVNTDSLSVPVNVTTPAAVVAVALPSRSTVSGASATSTSSGIVTVPISVSTDPGQSDYPDRVELLVNAVVVGAPATCPAKVHDCTVTIAWDARKYAGAVDVAARMTSSKKVKSTSPTMTVYARTASRTVVGRLAITNYLGVVTIRGRVIATNTNAGVGGVRVRLVRVPAVGKAASAYVQAGFDGSFAYRFKAASNTTVTALVGGGWIGASRAIQVQRVRAPLVCSAATSVRVGAKGTGKCVVRNLPLRTGVVLRYYFAGRWFTLASGRTKSTVVAFSFRFPRRGTYLVRVILGNNRVYTATAGRLLKVVVR